MLTEHAASSATISVERQCCWDRKLDKVVLVATARLEAVAAAADDEAANAKESDDDQRDCAPEEQPVVREEPLW